MNSRERKILFFVSLAHAANHSLDLTYAAVLGVVAVYFNASLVLLGLFATVSAFAFGLTALPGGFLADRLGSKRTIQICLYASGIAAALVGASGNVWVLGVTLALLGMAGGLYHPAGLAFITRGIGQRAKALGYHGAAGNVGVFLAPPLATAMVGIWNWRAAFLLVALISVASAVVIQRGRTTAEEGPGSVEGTDASTARPQPERSWDRSLYLLPLIAVFLVNVLGGLTFRASLTYLPLHLQENLGIDVFGLTPEVIGGMVAGVALFFGAVGQYVGGHLGERFHREFLLLPLVLAMIPALWAVGFVGGTGLIIAASVFAFFNFMAQPSYTALIADYTPSRIQGKAYGVMFTLGMGAGSFGGVLGGWIADSVGVRWVFPSVGTLAVGALLLTTYLAVAALRRRNTLAYSTRPY